MTSIIQAGPVRLSVDDAGTGPAVVLMHGLAGFKELWADTRAPLLAAGFRVITYDHRGHGGSADVAAPWGIVDLAADLRAVLDGLAIERACLVGHSMGGRTMFSVGLDSPERTWGLVAVGAQSEAPQGVYRAILESVRADTVRDGLAGFRRAFADAREIPERVDSDPEYRRRFDLAFDRNRPGMLVAALDAVMSMPRLTPRLGEIRVPMLAVVGARDLHFLEMAAHYATAVPSCRTVLIDGCEHYPMTDSPVAFGRELVAFVSDAWAMTARTDPRA